MNNRVDFLVIGGGLAGLTFGLHAAKTGHVMVLNKQTSNQSASDLAQGGIASVTAEDDSFEAHEADTLKSGAGLCNPKVVRMCIEAGPESIQELIHLGVAFSRIGDATNDMFDLGKEGGHSKRRVLHAGDFTGHQIMQALVKASHAEANLRVIDHQLAVNLIVDQNGICRGVFALNRATGSVETILSRCTVLATGGAGKVYRYTSNPDVATGDGMAMAYRAGAEMANLEFVQFHPTCLYHPKSKSFLLSEALRGEGGVLKLLNREEFLHLYDQRGSLATRDIVARAIDFELKKRGDDHALLDMTSLPADFLVKRFPNIHKHCMALGLDMTKEMLPVVPAAHYFCGGVRTDMRGRSSIAGLYAVGEVACTGFHGANRLASNSLLEAVVFARLAANDAGKWIIDNTAKESKESFQWDVGKAVNSDESVVVTQNWSEIRHFMWNYVGIVRSDKRLKRAMRRIEMVQEEIREYYWNFYLTPDLVELRNIATLAELVVFSAGLRKESRGLHYNLDYPSLDDAQPPRDTILRRGDGNKPLAIKTSPPHPYDWS